MTKARKTKHNLHTQELFDKVRQRLKLTEKQFPNKIIKKYYAYLNQFLLKAIMDNPEGFQMTIGNQLNGVFAVSKHMPKEMRDDKFEKLEEIQKLDIPEYRKKVYLKRYATAINRRFDYESINKDTPEYHRNVHSFFYSYRFMWFNHRNCKIKKTRSWIFEAGVKARRELEERIRKGQDYFELNFNDFYRYKVKPIN